MQDETSRPVAAKPKTLKDVSAASGLSLITVSRALREPERVQPETRARVHRAIREIGYVPNLTARSLVSSRSGMVGLVVPMLTSSLFADLAQGCASVLREAGLQMLLGVSMRDVAAEAEAVRTFIGRQADAIIVTGFAHTEDCAAMLRGYAGPVVETWNIRNERIDSAVGYDNRAAAAEMTRFLIGRGYRRIALVGGAVENNDQAADRNAGFLDTMREAGLPVDDWQVISLPTPTALEDGRVVLNRLMSEPQPPEAIFFHAEIPAQGAMLECLARGISVPRDLAIVGFGDMTLSSLLPTPLTTIRIRSFEIGASAARLVLDRLNGTVTEGRVVDVGYELVVRQSA